jgi:phenolic acid decarboxylase
MIGGSRYQKILGLGLEKFPNNLELHFWEIYFNHIIYGKEFTQNDCLSLIEKYNKEVSLVPYFFLYQFDKIKYKKQRDDLINEIELVPTAKNLYIKSLLL